MFRFKHILFLSILFFNINVFAYQSTDQSAIMAILPKEWVMTPLRNTEVSKNLQYQNTSVKAPNQEMILQSAIRKSAAVDFSKHANELFAGLKERLQQSCDVTNLTPLTDSSVPFSEWTSAINCKKFDSTGVIAIVDADPATTYIFIYQISNTLPHDNMLKKLAGMIKVCYKKDEKDSDCYFLLSS